MTEQGLAFAFAVSGLCLFIAAGLLGINLLSDTTLEFSGSVRLMAFAPSETDSPWSPGIPPTVRFLVADPTSESLFVELQLVSGCGEGASHGALILEGDARLSDADLGTPPNGIGGDVVTIEHANPTLRDASVQVIVFAIPELACPDGLDPGAFGTARFGTGFWSEPVVEARGTRSSASGPQMDSGDFSDLEALKSNLSANRNWAIWGPGDFVYQVEFGLTSSDELVGAPALLDRTNPLQWSGGRLAPQAEWTDIVRNERRALMFLIIGLAGGIGGSMAVTGFFDWGWRRLRATDKRTTDQRDTDQDVPIQLFDNEEE